MAKFNPFTGALDYTGIPVQSGLTAPDMSGDGALAVAEIASDGRLYFQVNGKRYYVTGTEHSPLKINIPKGQPIGLMGVTYANDVS